MHHTAIEVLRSYAPNTKMAYESQVLWEGLVEVLVVSNGDGWDVWNMHPLRKAWQHVYSLPSCVPSEQAVQSLNSLKRLFEKE